MNSVHKLKLFSKRYMMNQIRQLLLGDSQFGYCGIRIGRNFTVFRKEDNCNYSEELDNENAVKKTDRHEAATVLLR